MPAHKNEETSKVNYKEKSSNGLSKTSKTDEIPGSQNIAINVRIKKAHFSRSEENGSGECKIQIKYPVPLHFPVPTFPMDKIEEAQIQLEEDLKEYADALLSEEVLRAINVPAFVAETGNIDPLSPIGRLSCMIFAFMWIADDLFGKLLNDSKSSGVGINKISIIRFMDNCQDIINGKSGVSSDYTDCTSCPEKSRLLKDLHLMFCRVVSGLKELNPDYYNVPAHRQRFSSSIREWISAIIWFNEDYLNNIQTVSDTSVLFFRNAITAASLTIEFYAFTKGFYLEEKIRDDLFFKATSDSAIAIVTHLNDLLGILKEFKGNEPDNFLCHMLRKGTSLKMVAEYAETELSGRYVDYLLLSNRFRESYKNNQNLINYSAIVDRVIVGMLPWYFNSTRYLNNTKWENDILHFEI